eukprot:7079802-Pyramimonas_sp.AAC.1
MKQKQGGTTQRRQCAESCKSRRMRASRTRCESFATVGMAIVRAGAHTARSVYVCTDRHPAVSAAGSGPLLRPNAP